MRWCAVWLLAWSSWCAVAEAQEAQPPEVEEARAIFQEAEAAYREERYTSAAESYARSFAILDALDPPWPTRGYLRYNEGRALEHVVGREGDAIRAYQAFLELSPADPSNAELTEQRAIAERSIADLILRAGSGPSIVGLAIVGGGAAVLLAGIATGIAAIVMDGELRAQCMGSLCPSSLEDQAREIESIALATDVLIPIGAAALVVGLVLTFTLTEGPTETTVSCGPQRCGLQLAWRMP